MSTKQTESEASNPSLPFPTPAGYGEPVAFLSVALNDRGQAHFHCLGNSEQVLYLGTQAINFALTASIVEKVQQGTAQLSPQSSYPPATKKGNA